MAVKAPQLERAIQKVMKSLKANPVVEPKRPPFEQRRVGWALRDGEIITSILHFEGDVSFSFERFRNLVLS